MQKFDIEIQDREGCENQIADHLSKLESDTHIIEQGPIKEEFQDGKLLALEVSKLPWYVDIVNFMVSGIFPPKSST